MSGTPWLLSVGLWAALTTLPGAARADVMPPQGCGGTSEIAACSGKQAGDTCSFSSGTQGNCAVLRCTTDSGQAGLQCVATGANPGGGCSAAPGAAGTTAGLGTALLLIGLVLRRKRTRVEA